MNNETKQTAVEYLVKEISAILGPLETKPIQDLLMVDAIKKAKQMEKEQIIKAHNEGIWHDKKCFDEGEQYYNETYSKQEKL